MSDPRRRAFHRAIATAMAVAAMALAPAAQEKKTDEKTTVTGTWDVNLLSHQFALVLDQQGATVTGTLMFGGREIEMSGEFVGGKISLVGKGGFARRDDPQAAPTPIKLIGVMKDDGTLEGEAPGLHGDATWTAERLKKRK